MHKYTLLKIGIDRIIARIRIMATAYTNPDNIIGEEITTENSDNTFHHTIISLLPLPVRLVFRLESWRLIHWVELTKKMWLKLAYRVTKMDSVRYLLQICHFLTP